MMYVGLFQSVSYKLQHFKTSSHFLYDNEKMREYRVLGRARKNIKNEKVAQIILCKDA